jgi:hypothetical protein
LWPKYRVFIDGRFQVYGEEVLLDYLTISRAAARWEELLNRYAVDVVICSKSSHLRLIEALRLAEARWARVFQDDMTVIFRKVGDKTSESNVNTENRAFCQLTCKMGQSCHVKMGFSSDFVGSKSRGSAVFRVEGLKDFE